MGTARLPRSKAFNHVLQPLNLLVLCQQLCVVQLEHLCNTPAAVRHPLDYWLGMLVGCFTNIFTALQLCEAQVLQQHLHVGQAGKSTEACFVFKLPLPSVRPLLGIDSCL